MPSIPSVAMNGTTRKVVIASPLTRPTMPPTITPAARAASGGHPARRAKAQVTPVSATVEPGDKSMPPLTMMMVMPMAPMATMTVCASTMRRFAAERKRPGLSLIAAKMAMTRNKAKKGPNVCSQRFMGRANSN